MSGASGSKTSRAAAGPDFQRAAMHRGVAFADFDNDGRIDAVVSVVNGPAKLFHNIIGRRIALAGGSTAGAAVRIVRDSAPLSTCGYRMAATCTTRRPPRWGTRVRAKPWCGSDWVRIERRKPSRCAGRAASIQQLKNVAADRIVEVSRNGQTAGQTMTAWKCARSPVLLFALTLWGAARHLRVRRLTKEPTRSSWRRSFPRHWRRPKKRFAWIRNSSRR